MNHKGMTENPDFAAIAALLDPCAGSYESEERPAEEPAATDVSPLVLAMVGDAWFTLFVRRRLLLWEKNKAAKLHRASSQIVSAVCQAAAYRAIEDKLTDEEKDLFRRGRNAKSHAPTKSAGVGEYHASTGFETLLGALYTEGKFARLREIGTLALTAIVTEIAERDTRVS